MSALNKPTTFNYKQLSLDQEVFGLVYGRGIVSAIHENAYYPFEVTYPNGQTVPYTQEGYPAWNQTNRPIRTVFLLSEISATILSSSIEPISKILSFKKIIKFREEGKLEMRNPSGLWLNIKQCKQSIVEENLEQKALHLFRKQKKDKK